MAINIAYADLTATPVSPLIEGRFYSAITMNDNNEAELSYMIITTTDTDVTFSLLRDNFSIDKEFTLNYNIKSIYRLPIKNIPNEMLLSKNFFVKNDKWCTVVLDNNVPNTYTYSVIDEDGNNLGQLPNLENNMSASPIILLNKIYSGIPYLSLVSNNYGIDNNDYFQLFTFTGQSQVEAQRVSTLTNTAYPNPLPVGQPLTVEFDKVADDATFFSIIDMTGRQIYRHKIKAGENSYQFDGGRLGHGIYAYTVIYNDGTSISGRLMAE